MTKPAASRVMRTIAPLQDIESCQMPVFNVSRRIGDCQLQHQHLP